MFDKVFLLDEPLWKRLLAHVLDFLRREKPTPLKVTANPIAVADIWGLYRPQKRSWAVSVTLQAAAVAVLFTVGVSDTARVAVRRTVVVFSGAELAAYLPKPVGGGGGGGNRLPLPASKGRLPRLAPRQFTPPMAVVQNPNPKLIMEPTLVIAPDANLPSVNLAQYGDPLGVLGPASNGPGSGSGIGSGSGGGVGPGRGPGYGPGEGGGFGGGAFRVGGGVSNPVIIYKIDPEYSEEARKAKFMGTVVLMIVVDEKGNVRDIKVVRALGLGLDEKAIEAVTKWRFRPGYKDGKPVAVLATVEVNFRLP